MILSHIALVLTSALVHAAPGLSDSHVQSFDVRALSGAALKIYAPGSEFDGFAVLYVWPYESTWVNATYTPSNAIYADFNLGNDGSLGVRNRTICLLAGEYVLFDHAHDSSAGSYYLLADPTRYTPPSTCPSSDSWSLYRGAFLTWGGGYDKFCVLSGQGGRLYPEEVPYESGNSRCVGRARVSVVGYSIQPAPATPITPTTTLTTRVRTSSAISSSSTSQSSVVATSSTLAGSPTTPQTSTSASGRVKTRTPIATTSPPITSSSPLPNPVVTSAVSSIGVMVDRASSAVSSYAANATNSALAETALNQLEDAAYGTIEGGWVTEDEEASEIFGVLDSVLDSIFSAAGRAFFALAVLTPAAAATLTSAMGAAAEAAAAARAAAANPLRNPARTSRKPTSTVSSTATAYPCTVCNYCNDQAYPAEDGEPDSPDILERDENDGEQEFGILATRQASLCGSSFLVPDYESWSQNARTYRQYHNYYQNTGCGLTNFKYGFPPPASAHNLLYVPPGSGFSFDTYATEHVYEIQMIKNFVFWAYQNDPILANRTERNVCRDLGLVMITQPQAPWSAYPGFRYDVPPIQAMYDELADGAGGEFVYLQSRVNSVKGILFSDTRTPRAGTLITGGIPQYLRLKAVINYLQQREPNRLYRLVRNRIRDRFYEFGQACNDASAAQPYKPYGAVDWLALHNRWESIFLRERQQTLRERMTTSLNNAYADAKLKSRDRRLPRSEGQRYARLAIIISDERDRITTPSFRSLLFT